MSLHPQKKRVVLLRGGATTANTRHMEYGAEIQAILQAMPEVTLIDVVVTSGKEWLQDGIARDPHTILQAADYVYLALAGSYGADGEVQRVLERFGVPYLGSDARSTNTTHAKFIARELLKAQAVRMPRYLRLQRSEATDFHKAAHTIAHMFGPQYVIIPSYGTHHEDLVHVAQAADLAHALEHALTQYEDILVEEYIAGTDATCAVFAGLRGTPHYVTPVVEVTMPHKSYVTDEYKAQKTAPATLAKKTKVEIANMALLAHHTLTQKDVSRSDFKVTKEGEIYYLATHSLPSLHKDGLVRSALDSVGITHQDVIKQHLSIA